MDKTIFIFSPLPPQKNGIATHAYMLRKFFPDYKKIYVIDHKQHEYLTDSTYDVITVNDFLASHKNTKGVRLFQFGNNRYMSYLYKLFMEVGGIAEIHENINSYYQQFLPQKYRTDEDWTIKIAKRAQGVIVHSYSMYWGIKSILPNITIECLLTPPLIMVNENTIRERSLFLKNKYGISSNDFVFGAFGNADSRKMLIEAFQAYLDLRKSNNNIVFIAGGKGVKGTLQKFVQESCENNVILEEYLDEVDLEAFINISDLIINLRNPWLGENSGIAATAMGMGKCVLVSDVGSFAEYPDDTVLKIDNDSPKFMEKLFQILSNCLNDRNITKSIGSNAGRFIEKLAGIEYLSKNYQNMITQCHDYDKKRILIIATFNPFNGNGMSTSLMARCDDLRTKGFALDFLYYALENTEEKDVYAMHKYFDKTRIVWPESFYPDVCEDGISLKTVDEWCPEEFLEAVIEECARQDYVAAIANHIWTSLTLTVLPPQTRKFLFTHDNFANRAELFISQGLDAKNAWFSVSEEEQDIGLRRADVILAVQDQEARHFQNRVKDKLVVVTDIPLKFTKLGPRKQVRKIGWLASDNPNNFNCLNNLISDWNTSDIDNKGCQLVIAGGISKHLQPQNGESIFNYGHVLDIREFYEYIDLSINPDASGTGIKIKSLEALSFGRPLICTNIASRGLNSDSKYHNASNTQEIISLLKEILDSEDEVNRLTEYCIELFNAYRRKYDISYLFGGGTVKYLKELDEMEHCDRSLIKSLVDNLQQVPKKLPHPTLYKTYEECLQEINFAISEFSRNIDQNKDLEFLLGYYNSHVCRYANTLSRIPLAEGNESILEIGSGFSSLLAKLLCSSLGYRNFTGIDRLSEKTVAKTFQVNGEDIKYNILNIDLNKENEDVVSQKISERFDAIFCFEVLEHLWHPLKALKLMRSLLKPSGRLYLTTPNGASAFVLKKLFSMLIPQTYSEYNDTIEDTHYKEHTPLSLKYALAHAGLTEVVFDIMYCFSGDGEFCPEVQNMYPFPNQTELNGFLQGDTMFSITSPAPNTLEKHPNMFYNFEQFFTDWFTLYPEREYLKYYVKPGKYSS